MKKNKLTFVTFEDSFGITFTLSGSVHPVPHIWLDTNECVMYLHQKEVANLVKYLQHFVETGTLDMENEA